MSGYSQRRIGQVFSNHSATAAQAESMDTLRSLAHDLADAILLNTPACADQTLAIGRVREAVMYAVSAIVIPQN